MHTLIDGKQQLVIRYKNTHNQYKIGYMSLADIYEAYNNTSISEFDVLNNLMQWVKVSSFTRSDLPANTTGVKITTDHQTSLIAMASQKVSCISNPLTENQSYGSNRINQLTQGTNVFVQNNPLVYKKSMTNNLADESVGEYRTSYNPSRLGYLDGIVLAGFAILGGNCSRDGTVTMEYPAKYDARDHNFTESRRDQIINAARECLRLYDPYGLLTFKMETDNTSGIEKISFTSRRISEMILRYIISEAEAFGLQTSANDTDNPQYCPMRNLWLCMAHSELINPNRYYANDPIIRNDINNAVKYITDHMPAAGESYADNASSNSADDPIFMQVTISPDVLLESYDFRKGILKGLFDSGSITLHTMLPTKGLVNITRLIAVSAGLNVYVKHNTELDSATCECYDVMIDWIGRPNNVVQSKESVQISYSDETQYAYDIELPEEGLITLPNGMMILSKVE